MHAYLVLQLSKTLQVSLYSSRLVLRGIAADIGTSNFLLAFFILNSSSAGSIEQRPRNFPALSSLVFFDSPLLLFSSLQTYASTLLATHCRVLRSFVSSSVSPRTTYTHQVCLLIQYNESHEICPCVRHFSFSINVPVIFNTFLRHHI